MALPTTRLYYKANPSLKAANVNVEYTEEQLQEYVKCSQDPVHFIENYAKIISLDAGVVMFKLYPYQQRLIEAIHTNNRVIGKIFRQSGKCCEYTTPINIRNKETGEIVTMSIGDFYHEIEEVHNLSNL